MTKTVTVHAQQKWEYRTVVKHTENALLTELNEVGRAGWELVSASFNKDLKGIWAWTAVLKRPLAQQAGAAASAAEEAVRSEPQAETKAAEPALKGFDLDGDIFDIKAPEPEPKTAGPGDQGPEPSKSP